MDIMTEAIQELVQQRLAERKIEREIKAQPEVYNLLRLILEGFKDPSTGKATKDEVWLTRASNGNIAVRGEVKEVPFKCKVIEKVVNAFNACQGCRANFDGEVMAIFEIK